MPQYLVIWQMDIEAENPADAAEKARYYQTKPNTTATVFQVAECHEDGGALLASIDLSYPEQSEYYTTADLLREDLFENRRPNA